MRYRQGLKDTRPYQERPTASLLYDFYFEYAAQLEELKSTPLVQLDDADRRRLEVIEEIFDDKPPPSILQLIEEQRDKITPLTGDPILDRWYAMLDQGEVPEHFWGSKGKPVEE